jgi:hypothetical protein
MLLGPQDQPERFRPIRMRLDSVVVGVVVAADAANRGLGLVDALCVTTSAGVPCRHGGRPALLPQAALGRSASPVGQFLPLYP